MKLSEGTKSYLIGSHQFLLHPIWVLLAWRLEYKSWPKWWEIICIFLHDIGICGRQYLSVKFHQKYCSPQCKYLYSQKLRRARRGKPMDMPPIVELRIAALRDSWTPEQRIERRTINSPPLGTLE